jgi:hypothetical protein
MDQGLLMERDNWFGEGVVLNQEFLFCLLIAIAKATLVVMPFEKWSIREPIAHAHRWK